MGRCDQVNLGVRELHQSRQEAQRTPHILESSPGRYPVEHNFKHVRRERKTVEQLRFQAVAMHCAVASPCIQLALNDWPQGFARQI
jgi:hypothetical protein